MKRCVDSVIENETKVNCEILVKEDKERNGVAKTLHELLQKSKTNIVVFLADDTEVEKDCIYCAYELMIKTFDDGIGMVGFNDKFHQDRLATHFMIHKELIQQVGGYIFNPEYVHCYCDRELFDRVNELNKFVYSPLSKIIHHHPFIDKKVEMDEFYNSVYNKSKYLKDERTYKRRKENGWQ
jgi:GT2 family glycosyltransferase